MIPTHTGIVRTTSEALWGKAYLTKFRKVGKWWESCGNGINRRFDKDGFIRGYWKMKKWGMDFGYRLDISTLKKIAP
jgi:hypothetical protein